MQGTYIKLSERINESVILVRRGIRSLDITITGYPDRIRSDKQQHATNGYVVSIKPSFGRRRSI